MATPGNVVRIPKNALAAPDDKMRYPFAYRCAATGARVRLERSALGNRPHVPYKPALDLGPIPAATSALKVEIWVLTIIVPTPRAI